MRRYRLTGDVELQQHKCTEEFKRNSAFGLYQCMVNVFHRWTATIGSSASPRKRWRQMRAAHDLLSGPHEDMHLELALLRKENALLRQERDLLKKATAFFVRETRRCSSHASLRRRPISLQHACAFAQVSASAGSMHETACAYSPPAR